MLDLSDILVVTLEQAVAAPYCSCRLADAGARVIKIEREEGDFARGYDSVVDGESAYFVWLNRGKESLVLNIKDDQDTGFNASNAGAGRCVYSKSGTRRGRTVRFRFRRAVRTLSEP